MTATMGIRGLAAFRLGRSGATELIALMLFALFLAAIAPFGTAAAPPLPRHLYWQLAMIGGGIIAALIEPVLARRLTGAAFVLTQLVVMTPPIALWVSVLPMLLFGEPMSSARLLRLLPDVLVINVAVVVLAALTRLAVTRKALNRNAPLRTAHPVQAAIEGLAPPAIRSKLSPRLARTRLIAVEAEDHYLRIHTEAGSALVLMRLADALDALSGLDGFRTHRSWWVARAAVQTVQWKGGRGALALSNGSSAPVSRTYAAALKDTDWTLIAV